MRRSRINFRQDLMSPANCVKAREKKREEISKLSQNSVMYIYVSVPIVNYTCWTIPGFSTGTPSCPGNRGLEWVNILAVMA